MLTGEGVQRPAWWPVPACLAGASNTELWERASSRTSRAAGRMLGKAVQDAGAC